MIELQDAPAVGVIEHEDVIDDIPDMVAHIYQGWKNTALCGLHHKYDAHDRMHRAQNIPSADAPPGSRGCDKCGASACESCYALNNGTSDGS